MDSSQEYKPKSRPRFFSNWLMVGLVFAFLIAGIVTVWLTYTAVRDLVLNWDSSSLPSFLLEEPQEGEMVLPETLGPEGETALQSSGGPPTVPWDGDSRINVLVMGLDYRDWKNDDVPRTDTMMLFSLDPQSRTAGILSIPRDLWVEIPGFDYHKINTAYRLGEVYNVDGRGPGLAMKTVEELLGMEIDYYAQVDFLAFENFIDELGGVTVNVPKKIVVDPLGKHNTETLKAGEQLLPGYLALAYARSRNTSGSDFDRAGRQQQVIMAIRDRILSAELLPDLIKNSPAIYESLSSGISTNLTLMQLVRLAWVAQQISEENIRRGIIGVDQVDFAFSYDGQDILRPLPDEIRQLDYTADLIFLSACRTGVGRLLPGEGVMNLARPFLVSGCRAAVVTCWNINDKSTAKLVSDFYKNIKAGNSIARSLARAKREFINSEREMYRHPYFWAPYIVIGLDN